MKLWKMSGLVFTLVVVLFLTACSSNEREEGNNPFTPEHIHGLSYSPDGTTLIAATHNGAHHYKDGNWSGPVGESHDLMGFTLSKQGIFTSGHPAPSSTLPNPLGLMKSTDGGKTWESLKFQGESDFHYMTASFETGTLYIWNEKPNVQMKTGLYVSQNEGKKWVPVSSKGLDGKLITLAAHPSKPNHLAFGTDQGLYLKSDRDQPFQESLTDFQVTALLHDRESPDRIWVGGYTDRPTIVRWDERNKKKEELKLPFKDPDDAVQFIAQSSTDPQQLAISTFNAKIYTSTDGGKTWRQVTKGKEEGNHR